MLLHFYMALRATRWHKVIFSALFIFLIARSFTGAPEAQINFMGLIFDGGTSGNLTQSVSQESLGIIGPTLVDHRSASSTPPKSAEYKLYKKYVQPDNGFHIVENFVYQAKQVFISIQATSYYIKDLTLRSLHSNSPPAPVSSLLLTVFMCLFIIRIGVFGNYGEKKNNNNWGFSLQ